MLPFVANKDFAEEMGSEEQARKGIAEMAQPAATQAQALAHDIMADKYASPQIEVVDDGEHVYLVNHAHGAHLDEFGSVNNPPYAPLRRGAMAAGLRIEETPK